MVRGVHVNIPVELFSCAFPRSGRREVNRKVKAAEIYLLLNAVSRTNAPQPASLFTCLSCCRASFNCFLPGLVTAVSPINTTLLLPSPYSKDAALCSHIETSEHQSLFTTEQRPPSAHWTALADGRQWYVQDRQQHMDTRNALSRCVASRNCRIYVFTLAQDSWLSESGSCGLVCHEFVT
jgi:hypothetical protein